MANDRITLPSGSNQALGIAEYALDFIAEKYGEIGTSVLERTKLFFTDSIACGVAAIAMGANAPSVLRREAASYKSEDGACLIGSNIRAVPEKAILANSSAVRELDANGTNFGYNPFTNQTAGEFGHNDFYPVAVAAAQIKGLDGRKTLRGMVLVDEIRGRLAEAFSLKDHKIDHVAHGAIASAIGYFVAHHIPFRAIRAGHQLSDSKGASAAISTEAAIIGMKRAMNGFIGPADIFQNPQAIFRLFGKPFDLTLGVCGNYFSVMDMHFKLGLYEHQSAGAIHALIAILKKNPVIFEDPSKIKNIKVTIYEPAYGIICDPAKWCPKTRQSADHSLPYILATLIKKAHEKKAAGWRELMLEAADYDDKSLAAPLTLKLMEKVAIEHGGEKYDKLYPEGIPTSLVLEHEGLGKIESGLVMFPVGHSKGPKEEFAELLRYKFDLLAGLGVKDTSSLWKKLVNLEKMTARDVLDIFNFEMGGQ